MKSLVLAMVMFFAGHAALAQPAPAAAPEPAPGEADIVWARPGGEDLLARVYRPQTAPAPWPVIIDVHGGAWRAGGRLDGTLYDRALAAAGFLVISIDFRDGPEHLHPAASADVAGAVRWVRLNAQALGADADRIGLIGSSSGGHLAMLAALRAGAPQHQGTPLTTLDAAGAPAAGAAPQDSLSAAVDYVIALWPVSDPLARYRYAQRAGIDALLGGHEGYFGDEAGMLDASIPRIVTSGEAGMGADLPALLLVQPGADSNVPQDITLDLLRAYQSREGHVEYAFYPGQPHAFGGRESAASADMAALIADFARRRAAR